MTNSALIDWKGIGVPAHKVDHIPTQQDVRYKAVPELLAYGKGDKMRVFLWENKTKNIIELKGQLDARGVWNIAPDKIDPHAYARLKTWLKEIEYKGDK